MQLDEQRFARIDALCRRGDELLEGGDLDGALASYEKAWQQIPEPRAAWVVSTWVLSALADVYFYQGDYPRALQALQDAMLCPDGRDNAYLRLRLGQVHLELGDEAQAREALRQALAAGGGELFEGDDAKYLAFARSG